MLSAAGLCEFNERQPLTCLYFGSDRIRDPGTNYCSRFCSVDTDCTDTWVGGCCRSTSDGSNVCYRRESCDALDAGFTCNDGVQIVEEWVCDGFNDCSGAEDEFDCGELKFECFDGITITREWVCDGDEDCSTGEDESLCVDGEFVCFDSTSIPASYVCDGDYDCSNQEDETLCGY